MRKRFITHNHKSNFNKKIILIASISVVSAIVTFNVLLSSSIEESLNNSDIASSLIEYGTNDKSFLSFDLLNPKDMFRLSLNTLLKTDEKTNYDDLKLLSEHVNSTKPLVYIYNSHDTEEYNSSLVESYNIKYTVKIASYILSEYLEDLGIPAYVEGAKMSEYLSANGLLYKNSYEASRYYLEKRIEEYPSVVFAIDLHRDSVGRNATVASIDGKNYAKVLFVVGLDYQGFEKNREIAKKINSMIDQRLTRGIIEKTGAGVNGIYNQDIMNGTILLEMGGPENTIEEVDNTLKVISKVIFDYMKG